MKHARISLLLTSAAALLGGCTSEWDMQGVDPKDYYAAHPVENQVETRYETHTVQFVGDTLPVDQRQALAAGLASIDSLAVDSIQVQMHPAELKNMVRRQHIAKTLSRLGFSKSTLMFEPSETLGHNEARVDVAYAVAVTPHCPDWRRSPVTSYSNTTQGNYGCSLVTNIGLMAADPRDLVRGSGKVMPDAERNAAVMKKYKENSGSFSDDETGSAGASSSGGASASASP